MGKFRKIRLIIITLIISLSLMGTTYAFFNYYMMGSNQRLASGDVYFKFEDKTDSLSLTSIYPQTVSEARARTDNVITFTVEGNSTIPNKNIYYEILLNEGDEISGKTRFNPGDLVFDLIEIDEEGNELLVVDAMRYNDINSRRIWVNSINASSSISKTYKLRMWLSETVIISDTEDYANYTTSDFENRYASIKVGVNGDLKLKEIPLVIDTDDIYAENNKAYFIATISNDNIANPLSRSVTDYDEMLLEITATNSNIVFSYKDSKGNEVTETNEKLELSYNLRGNEAVEVQVFVTNKNDANTTTDVKLRLVKNGEEIQNFLKRINVYGNNFCLNNGLNKLYDCILASDSLETDVETAKINIANKGEVNLNDTAPSYTYVEEETLDVTNAYSYTGYKFYFSDSYEFDETTGKFLLVNKDGSNAIEDILSDNYKNYYTCGATIEHNPCGTIYRVKEISVDGTKYTISLGDKITYKIASSIRSEVGLYKSEDDYGDAYFYRGDVSNNNVYFGGYYWKIIRTNGDNSIRLIYNGETSNATGNKTSINNTLYTYSVAMPEAGSMYPSRHADPTYAGYMYGKNFARQTSPEVIYLNIVALREYYFADDYEFDSEKEIFRIKKKELDPVAKTFSEMNTTDSETGKKLYELYPYTCRTTTETGTCDVLLEVKSIVNETAAKVIYHSYSSVDRDGTRTNEYSSQVKDKLEEWYETNLVNKTDEAGNLITDYIVDGTFCNDRSTPNASYSSGYLIDKNTNYGAYTRLSDPTLAVNKTATLKCSIDENGNPDTRDWFSYTTNKGNGKLKYPIALITADEVAFAGGKHNTSNENYYLRTNYNYWTMSPGNYSSNHSYVHLMNVGPAGALGYFFCANQLGVRAVINIRSDVLISSGDGTIEKPFQLSIQ